MPSELYSYLLLNLFLGFFLGGYGTLVGAGGGFLLVPLFLLLHGLPHGVAAGTSLAIVSVNALSGAIGYMRQKQVDYGAGLLFGLATIPGALIGAQASGLVSGPLFTKVFGVFLMAVALYLFCKKPRATESGSELPSYSRPLGLGISLGVGVVSSLFGIGGGILHVPAMTEILKFPVRIAVATSTFILVFTAFSGAISHGLLGNIDWPLAASAGVGAVAGAQAGVRIAPRLRGSTVLRYLSLALLLVGLRLLFS